MLDSPFNEYVSKIEALQSAGLWTEDAFVQFMKEFLASGHNDGLTFEHILNSAEPGWEDALDRRATAGEAGLEDLWVSESNPGGAA